MKKIATAMIVATAFASIVAAGGAEASPQTPIHPDCTDNPHPQSCTKIVDTLSAEVEDMLAAFRGNDLDQMASFIDSPSAVTKYGDTFYRGWAAYRYDALQPVYETLVDGIDFDVSSLRYQVISQDVVLWYGDYSAALWMKDGSTVMDYRRTLIVWVKNPGDPARPYRIAGELDETL